MIFIHAEIATMLSKSTVGLRYQAKIGLLFSIIIVYVIICVKNSILGGDFGLPIAYSFHKSGNMNHVVKIHSWAHGETRRESDT